MDLVSASMIHSDAIINKIEANAPAATACELCQRCGCRLSPQYPEPKFKLNTKQREVYDYLKTRPSFPPTLREIGSECNISSTSHVRTILSSIKRAGLIETIPSKSRGIEVVTL